MFQAKGLVWGRPDYKAELKKLVEGLKEQAVNGLETVRGLAEGLVSRSGRPVDGPVQSAVPATVAHRSARPHILRLTWQLMLLKLAEAAPKSTPKTDTKAGPRWLISQRDDLIYLIGSVGLSYGLLVALFIFKVKPSVIFWLYVLLLDDPHVFGTFSRTYADPDEWRQRRSLLLTSLLFFLPGPVAVRLGLSQFFDIFGYSWAYYHISKQHYGFSILYKKKNNDLAPLDNWLDKALVATGFSWPFVGFLFGPNYPGAVRPERFLPGWLPGLFGAAFGASLTAYLGRQLYKVGTGQPVNLPKQLLLASSLSLHNVALRLPFARLGDGLYSMAALAAVITSYHNIQYDRLIWFHNQNKYARGLKHGRRYGLASVMSKDWRRLAISAVLFSSIYRIPMGLLLKRIPTGQLNQHSGSAAYQLARYIRGAGWGFAFAHYRLDAQIWRVRHDPALTRDLKIAD